MGMRDFRRVLNTKMLVSWLLFKKNTRSGWVTGCFVFSFFFSLRKKSVVVGGFVFNDRLEFLKFIVFSTFFFSLCF